MEIGPFIKLNRIKQGMTQGELAEGIVSESYLSKIENQRTEASPDVISLLSTRLGIRLNNDFDTTIKEKSQAWFDKLYSVNDKEALIEEYEELQELISKSYSNIQVMFEIHKIRYYLVIGNLDAALHQINYLKELSGTFDSLQQYYWMKFRGNYNSLIEDFGQALRLYKLAEEKTNQLELSEDEMADLKYTLGVTYSKLRHPLEVIDYANQSLAVFQKNYHFHRCAQGHVLLGISYRRLRIYDEAIKNYDLAHHLAALNKDKSLMNLANINLGYLHSTKGDPDRAIQIFKDVLSEEETLSEEEKFSTIMFLTKEYYRREEYEEVRQLVRKGLDLFENADRKRYKSYYYELKTYDYALSQLHREFEDLVIGEFIPYLQKQKDLENLILYSNMAGDHFESLNRYKKAARFYKLSNKTYEQLIKI